MTFWISQSIFAQYKIIDANNADFSNDTIIVIMDANKISDDDGTEYGMTLRFINGTMSNDSVRIQKKDAQLSTTADISYCTDYGCYTKDNDESDKFQVKSKDTANLYLHYSPHGTTDSAWVVYRVHKESSPSVEITILYVIATNIKNIKKENSFIAYPNPANQIVKINYTIQKTAKINLYDITGNKVKEFNLSLNDKSIRIDIADLPQGTYFYTLTTAKTTKTKRLIIRH